MSAFDCADETDGTDGTDDGRAREEVGGAKTQVAH